MEEPKVLPKIICEADFLVVSEAVLMMDGEDRMISVAAADLVKFQNRQ